MIREFLYKYYIDPIRYGQPYTLVDTLTYALILIAAVYIVYRGLRRYKIAVDDELVLATIPFVVLGGLLRVVEDTGMITTILRRNIENAVPVASIRPEPTTCCST